MRASSIRMESASSITAVAKRPLHLLLRIERQAIAQKIEPDLVGRGISDIASVGAAALFDIPCPVADGRRKVPGTRRSRPSIGRRGAPDNRSPSSRERPRLPWRYQTTAGTAASVLPSPVCISAIFPAVRASAPCNWTSNIFRPSTRSATTAVSAITSARPSRAPIDGFELGVAQGTQVRATAVDHWNP